MNLAESPKGEMKLKSFGGTGGLVTGSCHVFEVRDNKIMVDFGIFQGKDEILNENNGQRNFDFISEIGRNTSDILLTHSHMDHAGRIPMLIRNGFSPNIMATEETFEFLRIMYEDSLKIQKREKNKEYIMYDQSDVTKTLKSIKKVEPFEQVGIGHHSSKLTAQFIPNGHVSGSSSIIIRDERRRKNVLFTGDMGKPYQSLCGGYESLITEYPNDPINAIVVESTCFEAAPVTFEERRREMLGAINKTWEKGGVPVITTLSFHREQEIVEILHNFQINGDLPNDCRIFIDAPLAMKLSEVFKKLGPKYLTNNFGDIVDFYKNDESSMARFELENLTVINSHKESKLNAELLANYQGRAIVIASGGMGTRGRSVNYLSGSFNQNPKNSIIFTCYQVPGTPGAELAKKTPDSQKAEKIFLNGNSSHISGPEQTFDFLERFNLDNLGVAVIGHGRDSAREAMSKEFKARGYEDTDILTPKIGQIVSLTA